MHHRVRTVLVVVGSALVAPCVGAVPTVAQGPQPASAQKAPPATTVASSSELPPLQPGYWEFERTVFTTAQSTPQHTSIKKCSDPNVEIKQKLSDLQRKGCRFSPVLVRGNHYISSWRCPLPGAPLVDRNVVTVVSATSYQDDNEVRSGEHVSRSTVVAKRLGECPPPDLTPRADSSVPSLTRPR